MLIPQLIVGFYHDRVILSYAFYDLHDPLCSLTVTLREDYEMSKDVALHLVHNYGTRAIQASSGLAYAILKLGSSFYCCSFAPLNFGRCPPPPPSLDFFSRRTLY